MKRDSNHIWIGILCCQLKVDTRDSAQFTEGGPCNDCAKKPSKNLFSQKNSYIWVKYYFWQNKKKPSTTTLKHRISSISPKQNFLFTHLHANISPTAIPISVQTSYENTENSLYTLLVCNWMQWVLYGLYGTHKTCTPLNVTCTSKNILLNKNKIKKKS